MPEPPVTIDGDRLQAELSLNKATSLVKPFSGDRVIVEVAGLLTTALTVVGFAVIEKSCEALKVKTAFVE